jgi:hypothetical protein
VKLKSIFVLGMVAGCLAFLPSVNRLFWYPAYVSAPVYEFKNNPLQVPKVELGRALFSTLYYLPIVPFPVLRVIHLIALLPTPTTT